MINTKKVEFIISLSNLFSVIVDAPLDEDGEVDYATAEELCEKEASSVIQQAIINMTSIKVDSYTHGTGSREMQIEFIDTNEDVG